VQIATQQAANGYVLEIEDRGLGMSDQELIDANQRLANPPAIDFAVSRVLGLYVVGRLARRHLIKVQLRHSWYGGVTALAMLPAGLITRPGVSVLPTGELPELVAPARPRHAAEVAWSELGGGGVPGESGAPMQPTRPLEMAGPVEVQAPFEEPVPVEARIDHLPIFEQARSDWFDTSASAAYVPLRRQAPQEAPETGPRQLAGEGPRGGPPPVPVPPSPAFPLAPEAPPRQPPAPPAPPPAGPGRANLPRRVPRATMAPGLDMNHSAQPPPPTAGRGRTPDQIRAMLSSYSSGLERGRRIAGGASTRGHNGKGSSNGGGNGAGPGRPIDHTDGTEELP